jgi:hypothetical protein
MIKGTCFLFASFLTFTILAGCGVKGKPLPPLEPAEIGRGAPTYKRAAELAKPAVVPDSTTVKPSPTPRKKDEN